jgi:hypothetical protein
LERVLEGNFKGTDVCLGNSWDLRSCKQKSGESLHDYIRCFSKQRTELPNITDSDVNMAFLSGTTCKELVRELGRNTPTTANELMDIVPTTLPARRRLVPSLVATRIRGSARTRNPRAPTGVLKGTIGGRRRTSRASTKPRQTTLSLLLTARSLEGPRRGYF